jgi:hypothetical protein
MMNEVTPSSVLRAAAVIALSLLMALFVVSSGMGAGAAGLGALAVCGLAGAVAGRHRPYVSAVGATLLFVAALLIIVAVVYPAERGRASWWSDLAIWTVMGTASGLAAAALVQLLRWIVRRVKP